MKSTIKTFTALLLMVVGGVSQMWAGDVTTVYEKTLTGSTAWSAENDIKDGQWSGSASVSADFGMMVQGAKSTPSASITLSNIDANVILTYDIDWYSSTTYSGDYYSKIQLGSGVVFNAYGNGKVSATVNGTESEQVSITGEKTAANLIIHYIVNMATNTVTALSIKEGETELINLASFGEAVTSLTLTDEPTYTGITISTKSGNKARVTTCGLKNIKVQQETQDVATYGYTVNYKEGDNVVKTVTGSLAEGAPIPVLTALDGEGTYEGQHYLIVADAAPVQAVTSNPANNVLNVPVRKPYNTTLNVYRMLDGVKEAEPFITKPLTETDDKVANWVYTFSLCVNIDGAWYEATLKNGKFGEEGTFTNDALEKTVDYTLNADIVGFWDESHNGTVDNMNYSGGSMNTYWKETSIGTLEAGTYAMTAMQTESYSSVLYTGWTDAENPGTKVAEFGKDNRTQVFTLTENTENVYLYRGSNGRMDYILLKKDPKATVSIGEAGFATYSNAKYALDFTSVDGLKAYAVKVNDAKTAVELTQVTSAVPSSTGLLLQGAAKSYDVPAVATAEALANNDLIVTTGSTISMEDGYVYYGLRKLSTGEVGFAQMNLDNFTPSAGKAYLKVSEEAAARMAFFNLAGNETTGISTTQNNEGRFSNNNVYDLQGRIHSSLKKGLYIIGGKKLIVK